MQLDLKQRPYQLAVAGVGVFLLFGCFMAILAGTMLLWPHTALDRLWRLNPVAHKAFTPFGKSFGLLFYLLSMLLLVAAVGWFKRRIWGWRLAVAIFSTQVIADFVNLLRGDLLRGCVGALVAGALLLFLLRSNVRRLFQCEERSRGSSQQDG